MNWIANYSFPDCFPEEHPLRIGVIHKISAKITKFVINFECYTEAELTRLVAKPNWTTSQLIETLELQERMPKDSELHKQPNRKSTQLDQLGIRF
jgi:hypothetical protein